ncbi:MaoC family dehydratase N-terminal domain-containing protein [Micromonospora peucetia]|uniref:FAS1-like dehydratase domain-containing protein n=1 Tax=Micromonospora peucetia TaxID=47871 RepID=UPI0022548DC2|nr:MaoC family dehydratase N-terminal domain-containing protein [Micromonospora peucetia]MCX4388124.1 MaoC family dehydratase N-terminal domain-containing protein [Micromonospora peucetia]
MANPDAQGVTGAPFRLDVERGKIREFALATGAADAAYLQEEDPVVQPTFLTTTFFWQGEDSNPWSAVELDQQRGLHAEQQYTFFGEPPRAGTRLTCQSRIGEIYTKVGRRGGEMTFAVMYTDFRDETGRLVAQAKLTGVETARPPGTEAATQDGAPA